MTRFYRRRKTSASETMKAAALAAGVAGATFYLTRILLSREPLGTWRKPPAPSLEPLGSSRERRGSSRERLGSSRERRGSSRERLGSSREP